MGTYALGIALLVVLATAGPLYRKIAHARALGALRLDGAVVVPRLWGLGGLRWARPGWSAEVTFEGPTMGGGRPGHLRLLATLARPAVRAPAPLQGDLEAAGGRVAGFDGTRVEIAGPLLLRALELQRFLETCSALLDKMSL